jgi:hypothetical protein
MKNQDAVRAVIVRDKFEALMGDAQYALILLVNAAGDWALVEPSPIPAERAQTFHGRGLGFAGVLAFVGGKPRRELTELGAELAAEKMQAAADEFAQRWARSLTHPRWACPIAAGFN